MTLVYWAGLTKSGQLQPDFMLLILQLDYRYDMPGLVAFSSSLI